MYQRAFSTLGCPHLDLDGVLALAGHHRVGAVELRALAGSIDLPAKLVEVYGTPSALARRLRRGPVKIVSLDTSFKLTGSTHLERAALLEHVPWAEALGARLRVFDGGRMGDRAAIDEMTATIAWWGQLRALNRWQTDLMVETHDSLLTTRTIRDFLERAPDTGILWDAHHTWRKGGENPLLTWRAIRPHVVHIHVKDSVTTKDGALGFCYCLPGDGEFPMAALRAELQSHYPGPLSLEWEKLWHPDLPHLDEALRIAKERDWW